MCGIAGYVQRRSSPAADCALGAMLDRLAHRGPDGEGRWSSNRKDWRIELGHRRLAIVDLNGGAQPIGNESGSLQITCNGEIYNAPQLQQSLEQQGHEFRTRSDTESIIHQFEQHGRDGLSQLNGMFAFAIWDENTGELTLARDRAGIKPLYYAQLSDGGLVFASELTALLLHPLAPREINPQALAGYFFRDYVLPPQSIIRGVNKLPPGHFVRWCDGVLAAPELFWQPQGAPFNGSVAHATIELRETLAHSVEAHLMSDVPVGVFLSSGIDSSLVAMLAQRCSKSPISTFSLGFEDHQFDESHRARKFADLISFRHFEWQISERELLDHLDDALDTIDEPMADPSILPTFLVAKLAAQHVKVVLGGDGGDELFGGYPTYKAHRLARMFSRLPKSLRDRVLAPLARRLPVQHSYQSLEWKLKRFLLRWDDEQLDRHQRWMSSIDLPALPRAMASEVEEILSEPAVCLHARRDDPLNTILFYDFATYLSGSVLAKVDRASMAHGLEVRTPLLDNRLIDLAFSLPSSLKLRGTKTKWLLKRACRGILPRQVINGRKRGFAIPTAKWIRGLLAARIQNLLAESPLWDQHLLRHEYWQRSFNEHSAGKVDQSKPLWALLVFDHWHRRVFDRCGKAAPTTLARMIIADEFDALRQASAGLLYPSDTDATFDVFTSPAATVEDAIKNKAGGAKVEQVSLDAFFDELKDSDDAAKFAKLKQAITSTLADAKVFRAGTTRIGIYIIGKTKSGAVGGLHTKSVET